MKHSALIQERFLTFTPSLAKLLGGVNEAIVVQQIKFLLNGSGGIQRDGHRWIWNTYEQWQADHFPFWSVSTIKRTFEQLETMHVVESQQFDGYKSRKKYYRLNVGMVEQLTIENAERTPLPSGQNEPMEEVKMSRSLTDKTSENTTRGLRGVRTGSTTRTRSFVPQDRYRGTKKKEEYTVREQQVIEMYTRTCVASRLGFWPVTKRSPELTKEIAINKDATDEEFQELFTAAVEARRSGGKRRTLVGCLKEWATL